MRQESQDEQHSSIVVGSYDQTITVSANIQDSHRSTTAGFNSIGMRVRPPEVLQVLPLGFPSDLHK
jgi:hypothetical protein